MKNYPYKNRVFIPILTISILYNILWFTFFIFIILDFPDYRFSITVAFLIFYMAIAEPAKDTFIHFIFFKPLYPGLERKSIKDSRIKELTSTSDVPRLLKILVKDMNITSLTMIIKGNNYKISQFSKDSGKSPKIDTADLNNFFINVNHLMEEPNGILKKYQWNSVIPISYKNTLFGLLAFSDILDTRKRGVFESLASRIALLIENDILTEEALKNQAFKKEFSAARRIEKFLIEEKNLIIGNYNVTFKQHSRNEENDYILFENSLNIKEGKKSDAIFIIYCRISKSNKRKRIMMLFIISGYFLSLTKKHSDINKFIEAFDSVIRENGKEFAIEGYILNLASVSRWKIAHFGSHGEVAVDRKIIKFKPSEPLGLLEKKNYKILDLLSKSEISLSIQQGSHLNIIKNEK